MLLLLALNRFLYWRFIALGTVDGDTTLGSSGRNFGTLATTITVQFQQVGQIETRLLQDLDLANVDIVQRVHTLARLLDILGNRVGQQLVDDLLQIGAGHIAGDDAGHFPADFLDLRVLGIAGLALGHGILDGETDAEHTQQVAVGGLDVDRALDQGLPFLNHGPQFVGGQVHSVEVAQHVAAMDILGNQLELAERSLGVGVVLQIGQRNLKHAALQTVRGNPGALGTVHQGLADLAGREHVRGLDIVPILTGEGIYDLLFDREV
uniref:Putative secreted protein n=1 Tax=Psorophora albipes TaxID=869069 RepID=T1E295_9DIPT